MNDSAVNSAAEENVIGSMKPAYKMIVLRGNVVFPGQSVHFDLGRDKSVAALNKAIELNQDVFLIAQKHAATINPAPKDIYRVGTVAKIKQVLKMPNEATRVLVQGVRKMEIDSYVSIVPNFEVTLKEPAREDDDPMLVAAVKRNVLEQLEAYAKVDNKAVAEKPPEDIPDVEKFVADAAGKYYRTVEEKQRMLQAKSDYAALEDIYLKLIQECEIKTIERKISAKVRSNIDKNQREYFLREQIRVLH